MKITEVAIKRPVTSLMLFITLIMIGLIAGRKVPLEFFPDVTFPGLFVQIPYQASTPEEVEQLITRPVEEVLATISGIRSMNSSSRENDASIFMMMEMGTDVTLKSIEVREKIDGIRHLLPDDVERFFVRKFSATDDPVLMLRLSSEMDLSTSYDMLERILKNPLERVDGVSRVDLYGVNKRQIRIELNADRVASYNVDLTVLNQTLQRSNFSVTSGKIEDNGLRYMVRPVGEIRSIEELGDVVIGSNNLRLRDIADIRYDVPEMTLIRRLDQKPAIGLDIFKESGANTVGVAEVVMKELEQIKLNPEMRGIQIYEMNNQASGIKSSLNELLKAGMIGAGLSMIVLLFFLRSITTTLIVALAVPFSLTVTVGALYFLGLSLNIMSMMGLMLAVGMLVDNAVVVTENIHRHQLTSANLLDGTLKAVKQVGMAVTAGTLTTIIVFLPNIMMQADMTAVFMKHVAVAIVITLVSSLLVSLTIIPLLTTRLRQKPPSNKRTIVDSMADLYARILAWTMKFRWTTAGLILLVIASVAIPLNVVNINLMAFWRFTAPDTSTGLAWAIFVLTVAAAEAAVDDAVVARRVPAGVGDNSLNRLIAGRAAIGADREHRQRAGKQEGDDRADRVAIVDDRHAVAGAHALDLRRERGVIGGVEGVAAGRDLVGRGFLPRLPDRLAVEIGRGAQARGVLAGIERGPFGVAVGVHDIAMEGGAHHGGAGQKPLVEPPDMPVGVGQRPAVGVEPRGERFRHMGAAMGLAEDDRAVAGNDLDRVHAAACRSSNTTLPAFSTSRARPRPSR